MERMSEKEMLCQLEYLITDRRSFISDDKETSEVFQADVNALKQVIHDYKLLKTITFKSIRDKSENINIWINENIKSRKVEVLNIWKTDFDDLQCNAILYQNNKPLANIIASYDECELRHELGDKDTEMTKIFVTNAFKSLIYRDFKKYLELPNISKCSKLLQEIYDCVCESDISMCHITEEDWREDYSDRFNAKDLKKLQGEVEKYGLQGVIAFNDGEYKILGYEDLQTRFNDDRTIERKKEYER